MHNFSKFLPILVWTGGVPVAAHALQTVDLPGYDSAWVEAVVPAASVPQVRWTPGTPWLAPRSLDAPAEQGAAFVFVGAVDAATLESAATASASATDLTALLDEVQLDVRPGAERSGWLGQLIAALAAVGLVARRRLGVR